MILEWKIIKKSGHMRPKLRYKVQLEDFEKDLAVPMVRISSSIPKPVDSWQAHAWPGTNELAPNYETEYYDIFTPSHKTGQLDEVLTLPMRKSRLYPEVEESFLNLRGAYEQALVTAYENSAFEQEGRLELSMPIKKLIAPQAVAARFLKAAGL